MAYSWIPFFSELARKFGAYRSDQPGLVRLLVECGLKAGTTDQDAQGNAIPLAVIDPFSAFGAFLKLHDRKRIEFLGQIKERLSVQAPTPSDFNGVPHFQPLNFWLFPYMAQRKPEHMEALWTLYDQCLAGELQPKTFRSALAIPQVGVAKLTQALFCLNPDVFLPIDSQTKPYLSNLEISTEIDKNSDAALSMYLSVLDKVKAKVQESFSKISYDAWLTNQNEDSVRWILTQGAINNGYVHAGEPGKLFPKKYYGGTNFAEAAQTFVLRLPDGSNVETDIRASSHYFRARFGKLFATLGVKAGDVSVVNRIDESTYSLTFEKKSAATTTTSVMEPLPNAESETKGEAMAQPINRILFGPPGTGKTYRSIEQAVLLCDGSLSNSHASVVSRYRQLVADGQIAFVTFHQSFSYEDFVEGIRPTTIDGVVRYDVTPGIFREMCRRATTARTHVAKPTSMAITNRRAFKMSLGAKALIDAKAVFEECVSNGYVLLGWGDATDFTGCHSKEEISSKYLAEGGKAEHADSTGTFVHRFKNELKVGDIILISDGNTSVRGVAEVVGEYESLGRESGFSQMRKVNWLQILQPSQAVGRFYSRKFMMQTLYELKSDEIKWDELLEPAAESTGEKQFVLVIDEINRANISKVFGELITLLESDKRAGAEHELQATLPYSKEVLLVPPNLHVVGTMNTADRSIALLDTALRRRFEFRELMPQPEVIVGADGSGTIEDGQGGKIDLRRLLSTINERITFLFDREHQIGHAYLMSVKTFPGLLEVLRDKVIPLLQEYFYEDWTKIQLVFGDLKENRAAAKPQIIEHAERVVSAVLGFEDSEFEIKRTYKVADQIEPAAIRKIYMVMK